MNHWVDGLVYKGDKANIPRGLYNYQDKYLLAVMGERLYKMERLDDGEIKAKHLFDLSHEDKMITFSEMTNGNLALSDGWRCWILNLGENTLKEVL